MLHNSSVLGYIQYSTVVYRPCTHVTWRDSGEAISKLVIGFLRGNSHSRGKLQRLKHCDWTAHPMQFYVQNTTWIDLCHEYTYTLYTGNFVTSNYVLPHSPVQCFHFEGNFPNSGKSRCFLGNLREMKIFQEIREKQKLWHITYLIDLKTKMSYKWNLES